MRRGNKPPHNEKPMNCPHCRAHLTVITVMNTIVLSKRTCPNCGKDFLIENDVPKKTT